MGLNRIALFNVNKGFMWLWYIILVTALFLQGCPISQCGSSVEQLNAYIQKENTLLNTFYLKTMNHSCSDRVPFFVYEVSVFEYNDNGSIKICWKIKANHEINAKNLLIKAGEVPDGFQQTIPEPPEIFKPISGKYYTIFFETKDHRTHIPTMEWTAD